ncbi:MAG: glycosyltransferase family 2 protein [Flavobacteriaceae bacterium]
MEISVIIPLLNEAESIKELDQWISTSLEAHGLSYEVLYIDDGSTDTSWQCITQLASDKKHRKGIRFLKNYGKSQALQAGFLEAQGEYVVTMDADLQDSPEEIPPMVEQLKSEGLDIISGWKKKRYDSVLFKNIPSKLFNWAARRTSKIKLHDFNCGLKVYRKEVIKSIKVYGEMHRYIPVIAAHEGFTNIGEKIVQHQARKYGSSKFGSDRFIKGFLDLITLWFLQRFGKRPMHFFGLWGTTMLLLGFGFTLYLGIDKLFLSPSGRLITDRPEFYIALTTMLLGTQLFIAGFLGELLLQQQQRKRYTISSTTFKTK